MIKLKELKELASAATKGDQSYLTKAQVFREYDAAITPETVIKLVDEIEKLRDALKTAVVEFIKTDPEMQADGCECVVCGSSVDVDDNDWENGVDACWECKAHAYDSLENCLKNVLADSEARLG